MAVATLTGPKLPYVDNLANLVVAGGDTGGVTRQELVRVLAPNGVVLRTDPENPNPLPGSFFRKPWPAELDQWSHYLYDASNNAVSRDTAVDPPRGLRWTCGPGFARSHEHFAGMSAMVTAGGRLFTIIDEGPISSVYLPPRWSLVARDAFSGVQLWKKPIQNWESHLRGFRSGPPEIGRRIVAAQDRLYVALGYGDPVTVFDADTGDRARGLDQTRGAREWLMSSGVVQKKQGGELVAFALGDGRELWRAPCWENYTVPVDILVIEDTVWVGNLRQGDDPGFTEGRDLNTGRVVATLPPQKAWGHHRCYRNKATVRWLMVGRGGVQFVDPKTGAVHGNSWTRGACQYGTMPANGLVYVPQHSCACQPRELLAGFNALAPQSSLGPGPEPLERGAVYPGSSELTSDPSATDWQTYRRDVHRSGYQNLAVPERPDVAWTAKLSAPITAPVAADRMVFAAETDRHTVHALSAESGEPLWTFVADGRIDSPPPLWEGLCLFGTRNGFVVCLRAADGVVVWRFRAAPRDRRLFAYGQLESVWPVHGSVLVDDRRSDGTAVVYFSAGRSSRIDGGIRLYALDAGTGKVLHRAVVRLAAPRGGIAAIRRKALPDILSLEKGTLWMRGLGVDRQLRPVADRPHLFAPRGFLDDTWWHRTYWIYGTEIGGGYTHWPEAGNVSPAGRLLVLDGGELIYGYGRMAYQAGKGHVRPDMTKDYNLFAEELASAAAERRGEKRRVKWARQLPFVARALVLTRDACWSQVAYRRPQPPGTTARAPSGSPPAKTARERPDARFPRPPFWTAWP